MPLPVHARTHKHTHTHTHTRTPTHTHTHTRPQKFLAVEMDRTKEYLRHTGVCSEVHHKEQYIPQHELEGELPYKAYRPPPTAAYRPPPAACHLLLSAAAGGLRRCWVLPHCGVPLERTCQATGER